MKVTIKGLGIKLTDAVKEYCQTKLVDVVGKYFDDESTALDIIVRDINGPKGGVDKEVSVIATVANQKNPIKVSEIAQFEQEAIDRCSAKLDQRLRKIKDIATDH